MSDDKGRPTLSPEKDDTRVRVEVDVPRELYERYRREVEIDRIEWEASGGFDTHDTRPTMIEDYLVDRIQFDVRYFVDGEPVAGIYVDE